MKRYLAAVVVALAVLGYHTEVQASCYTNTVWTSDGRVLTCTTCCDRTWGCTTTCL